MFLPSISTTSRSMPASQQVGWVSVGWVLICGAVLLLSTFAGQGAGSAQAAFAQGESTELDEVLFVQAPEGKPGVARDNSSDGIVIAWIPEPILRFCLGKTMSQCSAMDYCIRTTTKQVPMCRNLAIPLSRLPSYPPGMRPRRVMSLSFYKLLPGGPYQALEDYYKSLPRSSLGRISMDARIKARIRFTPGANDDDFRFEQVLATAPF